MGSRNTKSVTRPVAIAQSIKPKTPWEIDEELRKQNPELYYSQKILKDNKMWDAINATRDDILTKYESILSDPKNYFPKYNDSGFAAIDNIKNKKPDYIRKSKTISDVLDLLKKTKYGELEETLQYYADQLQNNMFLMANYIPDNPNREFIRVPHWHKSNSNNPEYKKFYKNTKDVGDRVIKFVNKRFSQLSPEDQIIKDIYLLDGLRLVMVDSINELAKSPLPWNRSFKYNNNLDNSKNYAKQSDLIGADEKIINAIKSNVIDKNFIKYYHNNAKNAILSEISTQRKIANIANNATKKRVENYANSFSNEKVNSEKDIKDLLDDVALYRGRSIDDELE
jgi:hypothetical protein